MRVATSILLAGGIFLFACAQEPLTTSKDSGTFVRGRAKVISVDALLGTTLLEYQGRQVHGYWSTEHALAQGGSVSQPDPLKPPVANYQEPVIKEQKLAVQPGDTIEFMGMWTGSDILLRGVAVVSHPQ